MAGELYGNFGMLFFVAGVVFVLDFFFVAGAVFGNNLLFFF